MTVHPISGPVNTQQASFIQYHEIKYQELSHYVSMPAVYLSLFGRNRRQHSVREPRYPALSDQLRVN